MSEMALPTRLRSTEHPLLYEVNTRVLLGELSRAAGHPVGLGTMPENVLSGWAELGFDAVWLMGIWSTGPLGREIARNLPLLANEYHRALPDLTEEDIGGSPYAITEYTVPDALGGEEGLAHLRKRLAAHGMGLILDFVPNHTACDAPWVNDHPEYYISGIDGDESVRPQEFFAARTRTGRVVLAHGRDPIFPPWTDTAQLNIFSPELRKAQTERLKSIAGRCDGVRCDMAMLLLRDVFSRTWSGRLGQREVADQPREFWQEMIEAVRSEWPQFLFLAEAYWKREWDLQELGFNYTYDKVFYDRLLREGASSTRDHLRADPAFQRRSIRFIENHDEPRAARQLSSEEWHCAAALIASSVPGMVLLHEGQLEGWTVKVPVQLLRRMAEPGSDRVRVFYRQMLGCLKDPAIRQGQWQMLEPRPAWQENPTWENFLAFLWQKEGSGVRLVVVNYAPHSGQCYVTLPEQALPSNMLEFKDLLSPALYVRERAGVLARGMYFDLPGYGCHLFDLRPARK